MSVNGFRKVYLNVVCNYEAREIFDTFCDLAVLYLAVVDGAQLSVKYTFDGRD